MALGQHPRPPAVAWPVRRRGLDSHVGYWDYSGPAAQAQRVASASFGGADLFHRVTNVERWCLVVI